MELLDLTSELVTRVPRNEMSEKCQQYCAARGNCSFMLSNSTEMGMYYSLNVQDLPPLGKIKGPGKGKKMQSQQHHATKATQLNNKYPKH